MAALQLTVLLLLIFAFANLAECVRPLRNPHLSAIAYQLLQTPPKPHRGPPLSPALRDSIYSTYRKPPSPIEESRFGMGSTSTNRKEQWQHHQYTYNMLHKNPAGPNPIGNEYRPNQTQDESDKKNRSPPAY